MKSLWIQAKPLTRWAPAAVLALLLAACAHPGYQGDGRTDSGGSLYDGLMALYRGPLDHLSAVRQGSCPMYPSCSEYSRRAVAKHGFAMGWAMTTDRLVRCGRQPLRDVPRIWAQGAWKIYDPVEANDFWWSAAGSRTGARQVPSAEPLLPE